VASSPDHRDGRPYPDPDHDSGQRAGLFGVFTRAECGDPRRFRHRGVVLEEFERVLAVSVPAQGRASVDAIRLGYLRLVTGTAAPSSRPAAQKDMFSALEALTDREPDRRPA
jgi:hypothetical protein